MCRTAVAYAMRRRRAGAAEYFLFRYGVYRAIAMEVDLRHRTIRTIVPRSDAIIY